MNSSFSLIKPFFVLQTSNSFEAECTVSTWNLEHSIFTFWLWLSVYFLQHLSNIKAILTLNSLSINMNATQPEEIPRHNLPTSIPPIRPIFPSRRRRRRIQLNWHNSNTVLRGRTPQRLPIVTPHLRHAHPPSSHPHSSTLLPTTMNRMIVNLIRIHLRTHIPMLPLQLLNIPDLVRGRFIRIYLIASNGSVWWWWGSGVQADGIFFLLKALIAEDDGGDETDGEERNDGYDDANQRSNRQCHCTFHVRGC